MKTENACSSVNEASDDENVKESSEYDESSPEDETSQSVKSRSQGESSEEDGISQNELPEAKEEDACFICLEIFSKSNPCMVTMCCKNPFHFKCISKWRKKKKSCPLDCDRPLNLMELKRVDKGSRSCVSKKRKNNHGSDLKKNETDENPLAGKQELQNQFHFNCISKWRKKQYRCLFACDRPLTLVKLERVDQEQPIFLSTKRKNSNGTEETTGHKKQATNCENKQANYSSLAGKSDKELNELFLKWKRNGLLRPQSPTCCKQRGEGSKHRSIVECMYPRLFEEYPQHPNFNDAEANEDSLFGVEAYHESLWLEFMKMLQDVAGLSMENHIATIVAKIGKAERFRDEIGFDVRIILARLKVLFFSKKEKLEVEQIKLFDKQIELEKLKAELENVEDKMEKLNAELENVDNSSK